jgi:ribonuclease P protein component
LVRFTALNKKNDFFRLKKETNCFTEKGLRVYIEKNQEKVSRLGISISSKQTTAVERNKFKRRIKEAVRGLEDKESFDIYIIGSKKKNLNLKILEIQKIISSHPKLIKK